MLAKSGIVCEVMRAAARHSASDAVQASASACLAALAAAAGEAGAMDGVRDVMMRLGTGHDEPQRGAENAATAKIALPAIRAGALPARARVPRPSRQRRLYRLCRCGAVRCCQFDQLRGAAGVPRACASRRSRRLDTALHTMVRNVPSLSFVCAPTPDPAPRGLAPTCDRSMRAAAGSLRHPDPPCACRGRCHPSGWGLAR